MSLFDKTTQELRHDVARITSIKLHVPDEDTCQRALAETGEDWRPKATLVVELEPMSFRRAFEDTTDVNENLPILARIPITYGSVKNGLTVEELPAIRSAGFYAIPSKKLITLDRNLVGVKDADIWMPYQRWAKKAIVGGLSDIVDFDATTGQAVSPRIGQLVVIESGMDRFPGGDSTYGRYMTYITGTAPADFVAAPVSERETVFLKRSQATDEDAPTTNTASVGAGVSADSLREAFEAAGFVGKPVTALDTVEAQQIAVSRAMRFAPVFGSRAITDAADSGELINYAVKLGAITLTAEGTIALA